MKATKLIYLLLLIVVSFHFSCNKKNEKNEDLTEKIYRAKGNGWKSKISFHSFKGMNYKATQVPIQYYFLKNESSNPKKIDSLYQINKGERVIEFEFSNLNKDDV